MKSLTAYQRDIIEATDCRPEDAEEIEDYMRNVIFHSTLDWQSRSQFNRAAKIAYKDIIWMRSPKGQSYMSKGFYSPETTKRNIATIDSDFIDTDCMGNCFSDADPRL